MRSFDDVLRDIGLLQGTILRSIAGRSDITLVEVNPAEERLFLRTGQGKPRSRPLSELRTIWRALNSKPAVHVDSVLGGSGTSRNQPETILANLPYIEWLYINNKKHLALVPESTHPIGELKQMDPARAEEVRRRVRAPAIALKSYQTIIVTRNITETAGELERATGMPLTAIEPYLYCHERGGILVLADPSSEEATEGTYFMMPDGHVTSDATRVDLGDGTKLYLVQRGNLRYAVTSSEG